MLKLLVVEDHTLVREGLVQVLHQLDKEIQVFEAGECDGALALLEAEPELDLVLLDIALPGIDGLACLNIFRTRFPATPVVLVSAYDDAHTVNRALKHGASGFIPKAYSTERLLAAIRQVLAGNIHTPEQLMPVNLAPDLAPAPVVQEAPASEFGLTERQAEVLGLMSKGKSNRDIATLLGLSEGTVKIHVTAIFKALGVNSRTQALVAVARLGIRV